MRRNDWTRWALAGAVLAMSAPQGVRAEDAGPKQVTVSVEFVDVDSAVYAKASKGLPAGGKHDALLLAALRKEGVAPVMAPRLTTADGVAGRVDMSQEMHYKTDDGKDETLKATSGVGATPHCLTNGAIGCNLHVLRQYFTVAPNSPQPSIRTRTIAMKCALPDGEMREVGGRDPAMFPGEKTCLFFITLAPVGP
jgi:type II secretory pathway component HofQ